MTIEINIEAIHLNIHIHQSSPMADAMVKAAMEVQQVDESPAETEGREIEIPADVQKQVSDKGGR